MSEEGEQTKILREILKWTRFAGMPQVKAVLEETLNSPEKKHAFQLSDGTHGTIEVGKLSAVGSKDKVAGLWKAWLKQGLGETVSVKGGDRFKRAFDLEELGIEVPAVRPPLQSQQSATGAETVSPADLPSEGDQH
jgi:hypothetical protein